MAFTKIVGAGIHTLSNVHTHNINSSGIITATQFVGIFTGTDGNFSGDLDVGGNVSIGGSLTVNGDFTTLNTTLREVEILNVDANSSESAGIITQRGSGDILNLFDTNTEVFTVKDGGNVGIKTDSPTSDLQVDGTSLSLINKVDNSNTFIKVENTGPGNAGVKIKNSNGEFTFIANDRLRIMDEDAGGVERITLASNGNVGINSTIPGGVLDLYHATSNTILNVKSGDAGSVINLIDNATRSSIEQNGISLKISSDTVGTYANSDIRLQVDSATKMMIDHDGHVGINTTNPQDLLHIGGDTTSVRLTSNQIKFNRSSLFSYIDQYGAGGIAFRTTESGSQYNRISIISNGNIGINEDAPSEKLQIDGDILLGGQANSSESNYAIKFEYNNHQFAKIVGDGRDSSGYGDIDFYTSPTNGASNLTQRMSIRADGKIGIGNFLSSSPSAAVHIDYESNNLLMLDSTTGSTQKMFFAQNGGTHAQIYGTSASGALTIESDPSDNHSSSFIDFRVDGGEKLRITSDGELRIATRNSANGGEVGFKFGSFGIRSQDTGGYNWWRIDRNYGGWQSDMISLRADGNVGINDSNPTVKLSVDGGTANNATVVQIKNDSTSAYSTTDGGINTALSLFSDGTSATQSVGIQFYLQKSGETGCISEIGAVRESSGNSNLVFRTRNSSTGRLERFRITSGGQLRAGDESSSNRTGYRHQFSSTAGSGDVLSLQNPSNSDGQGIGLGFWARNTNNAAIEIAKIKAIADETQANSTQEGSLQVLTNGGASMGTRIDIDQTTTKVYTDIHVLKGSTVPGASLLLQSHDTANATARIQFLARDNGNVNETCKIQADSSGTANVDLQFHTGAGEMMRIERGGNVKIGGSGAPGARLQIDDSHNTAYNAAATTSTGQIYIVNTAANGASGIIFQTPSTDGTNISQASIMAAPEGTSKATMLTFGVRNSSAQNLEQIRIASNGFIGAYRHGTPLGRFHSGYVINQSKRSYSNNNEGFVLNVDRDHSSGNYQGFVDFVAARASDNTNGGTRMRFFAQPRNTGVNRMIVDMNGTLNHVRMGNACHYSYGSGTDGDFTSSSFTHYDHKEGGNVTHLDFEATRSRTSAGGYGGTGGIGPKQSTLMQSYATPYKYEIKTPNHESDSANRYYPVSFQSVGRAGGGMIHTMQVARRYHDDGPSDYGGSTIGWTGSSTHQGGLDLFLQVRDSAWSDMYDMRVMHYRYTYHQTVGGWGMFASYSTSYGSGPFYLMLRGGFKYQVYAAHPMAVANVQPGGRVYSTSYGWYWPASTTSTSGALNGFSTQYYAGTN